MEWISTRDHNFFPLMGIAVGILGAYLGFSRQPQQKSGREAKTSMPIRIASVAFIVVAMVWLGLAIFHR